MMLAFPHHDPSVAYVNNPRPCPGETVTVEVDVPHLSGVDTVMLRYLHDGEGRWAEGRSRKSACGHRWRFELPCHNRVTNYRFWLDGGDQGPRWLTGDGLVDWDPPDHGDFRLLTNGGAPPWVSETVWYQIFPDRFATSERYQALARDAAWAKVARWDEPVATGPAAMTQLYGGDLDGIVEHLDHLRRLGVGGIYLTPFFPARSNHRYDATTFDRVDPILGGDEALVRLRRACDGAGIRLLADLTLNHTGDGHDWFRAARNDPGSPEAGFYYFTEYPDEYESWLGIRSLPKLNHGSAELAERLYAGPSSVVARFLEPPFDLAGWRIDVANMTGRYGTIDLNRRVRRATRATVDAVGAHSGRDRWLIGENFFDPIPDGNGDGWQGVMNYAGVAKPLVSWLGEFTALSTMSGGPGQAHRGGQAVARSMDAFRAGLPWAVTVGSMALTSSHDTARWRSMVGHDELALLGFGLLLAMPGSPCFFYGDEIGLKGANSEAARVPMPWHDRDSWNLRFYDRYRELIGFRSGSSALAHGGMRWVACHRDALCFLRESDDERVLVLARRSDKTPAIRIPTGLLRATALEGKCGTPDIEPVGSTLGLPNEGIGLDLWRVG